MIALNCPGCRLAFRVDDAWAGRTCTCRNCQTHFTVPSPAAFSTCPPVPQPPVPQASPAGCAYAAVPVDEDGGGKTCALLSVIFGSMAFLFFPILFGPAGLVLGIIGTVRCRKKGMAITGIVLSAVGTIAGMIIGACATFATL